MDQQFFKNRMSERTKRNEEKEKLDARIEKLFEVDYQGLIYYIGVRGLLSGFLAGSAHLAVLTFLRYKFNSKVL